MDLTKEYKLTEKEHDLIFGQIVKVFLHNKSSTDNPSIVILSGQPGCGKTELIKHYRTVMFTDDNFCYINRDELRRFHPKSDEIFLLYNRRYAEITNPDAGAWARKLFDLAVERRLNIIFEVTMQSVQICEIIRRLSAHCYHIIISPMATPFIISTYSICNRYLIAKKETGKALFVPFSSHDEAYTAMISTLIQVVSEKYYNEIVVYSRDLNGCEEVTTVKDEDIPKVIKDCRSKILTIPQRKKIILLAQNLILDLNKLGEYDIMDGFTVSYRKWQASLHDR